MKVERTYATPVGNLILAKPVEAEEMKGGLYLAEAARERPAHADVIAVGDDVTRCKPGDRVLHRKYVGSETELNEERFLILENDDVQAIVTVHVLEVEDDVPATSQLITTP